MSRIISGHLKGRRIIAPKHWEVRPTTDRAKEALFNILRHRLELDRIRALDLFGGIGSIALEMASRGALEVTSVEINPKAAAFIEDKAQEFALDNVSIIRSDVERFIQSAYRKWDLIFADPPYTYEGHRRLVDVVFSRQLLEEDGLFVVEHGEEVDLRDHRHFVESRKYSRVIFSFFAADVS